MVGDDVGNLDRDQNLGLQEAWVAGGEEWPKLTAVDGIDSTPELQKQNLHLQHISIDINDPILLDHESKLPSFNKKIKINPNTLQDNNGNPESHHIPENPSPPAEISHSSSPDPFQQKAQESFPNFHQEYLSLKLQDQSELDLLTHILHSKESEISSQKTQMQQDFSLKLLELEKELQIATLDREIVNSDQNLLRQKNDQKVNSLIKKIDIQKKTMSRLETDLNCLKKQKLEILKRMRERAEGFGRCQTKNEKV